MYHWSYTIITNEKLILAWDNNPLRNNCSLIKLFSLISEIGNIFKEMVDIVQAAAAEHRKEFDSLHN